MCWQGCLHRLHSVRTGSVLTNQNNSYIILLTGKWIGVILDKPLGKNNGTVEGKKYFECADNYGMFCRQTQLKILSDSPGKSSRTPSRENSSLATPRQKSDLSRGESCPEYRTQFNIIMQDQCRDRRVTCPHQSETRWKPWIASLRRRS